MIIPKNSLEKRALEIAIDHYVKTYNKKMISPSNVYNRIEEYDQLMNLEGITISSSFEHWSPDFMLKQIRDLYFNIVQEFQDQRKGEDISNPSSIGRKSKSEIIDEVISHVKANGRNKDRVLEICYKEGEEDSTNGSNFDSYLKEGFKGHSHNFWNLLWDLVYDDQHWNKNNQLTLMGQRNLKRVYNLDF